MIQPGVDIGHLYEQLAGEISLQIGQGVFRPGERLPSVRRLSSEKRLSVTTIMQAYQLLEDRGLIEARPQSGYYVRGLRRPATLLEDETTLTCAPETVRLQDLARRVREDAVLPELVQFGAALPSADVLPGARLSALLARLARSGRVPPHLLGSARGCAELRVQVARRVYLAGCTLAPEEILITSGCTEALNLALRAVCSSGDLVAIESPTYFGVLQVLEALGLRALEIACHPKTGLCLDALTTALERFPVRAVVAIPNFNNPLGGCMPDENKRLLVEMLAARQIPLIEDDIYGELSFSDQRPRVARMYDPNGGVMLCSSFSKTLSPGFRVGWIAGGRWNEEIERQKAATNLFTPLWQQLTVANFLDSGGYDHVLRRTRRAYAQRMTQMADAVLRYFPPGTRVTSPEGGFVLWVQLPDSVDSLDLYRGALAHQITLAPGYLFAPSPRYRNFVRLNAAVYSPQNDWAVRKLGELTTKLAAKRAEERL